MRVVETKIIAETVEKLFLDANCTLPCDLEERIRSAVSCESRELAREALGVIADNLDEAKNTIFRYVRIRVWL
mgnify:CR=1 FL=1